ncbi:uncharacterized protein LOC111044118 [Nilaparvata lugens]|uniref:uncharacterized protein LOC111044118 n=1 Tax=Nilaparvata lugens TaxID=108931 RepID=UPI00193D8771|nr:uncharacterized protein LOC111044118 [Nilaparvata lugens]
MHDVANRKLFPHLYCNDIATPGVINRRGTITSLANRQGVLIFESDSGRLEQVFFLASKLYVRGTRVKAALNSSRDLEEGTEVTFDAVPCHSHENEFDCQWFATVVWYLCKKPRMEYDLHEKHIEELTFFNKIRVLTMASPLENCTVEEQHAVIRFLVAEVHHLFLHVYKQFGNNAEYGIALGSIKPNVWQSILFHRSMCFLFKLNLSTKDLREIFKKGDKINFIAVPSPKKYIAQMIATQISIYSDPRLGPQM